MQGNPCSGITLRLSAEHAQDAGQTGADQQVDQSKEHSRQSRHDKDHHGGQQHFAAGRPYDFANFSANLLDELNGICGGHVAWSLC